MHILSHVGFCETCVSKEKKEWSLEDLNTEGLGFFECLNDKSWQNQRAHSAQVTTHLQAETGQDLYATLIMGVDQPISCPAILSPEIFDENVDENAQKIDHTEGFFQRLDDLEDNHSENSAHKGAPKHEMNCEVNLSSASRDQNTNLHHMKKSDDPITLFSSLDEKKNQMCFSPKEKEGPKKKLSDPLNEKISLKNETLEDARSETNKITILPPKEIQLSKMTSSPVLNERLENTLTQIKTLVQKKRDVTVHFPIQHPFGVLEVRLRFQNKNVCAVFSSTSKKLMRLLGQHHKDIEKIFESFSNPEIRFHNKGDL